MNEALLRDLMDRVERVEETVEHITAQRPKVRKLPYINRVGHLADVVNAFNDLLDRIQGTQTGLRRDRLQATEETVDTGVEPAPEVVKPTAGECQLSRSNATTLILSPYKGNKLAFPSGAVVEVPSAGVTVDTTGLAANTVYFVYALTSDDEEVTSLELSSTGYATDSASGITIKSGADTHVLVGMVRTNASTQFVDATNQRFVRTWFNDPGVSLRGSSVSGANTFGTGKVLVASGEVELVAWAGEYVDLSWYGYHKNNTALSGMQVQMFLNGSVTGFGIEQINVSNGANDWHGFHVRNCAPTGVEGYNYIGGYHQALTSGTTNINTSQLVGHTRGMG